MKGRIRVDKVTATTSGADVWSSNTSKHKVRYIIGFVITGDGTNDSKVTVKKVAGTTETEKYDFRVEAKKTFSYPGSPKADNPVLVLEGNTNLKVYTDTGSPTVSVIYYDEPP